MRVALAPMEGVVDWALRQVYSQIGGYDHFVTEFVRVSIHVLPKKVFYKYCPELNTDGKTVTGVPVYLQLLGSNPELMGLNAQRAVELGAPGIDLNFGCPAKRVNNSDGGAALLKDPQRVYDVIYGVKKAVGHLVPVTAKIRLGFEDKSLCVDIAKAVDSAGADQLTIHARTKMEGYKPPAHWEYIAKMKSYVSLPVVANGEIWNVEDYVKCREISSCDDVAIGRPAISRPNLANEIKAYLANTTDPQDIRNNFKKIHPQHEPGNQFKNELSWDEIKNKWLPEFIERSAYGHLPDFPLHRVKQWTKLMGKTYPESAEFFQAIKKLSSIDDLLDFINN